MLELIKELLRDKFYDNVEVGGSFTFYSRDKAIDTIYHIVELTDSHVTYKRTWYGHVIGDNTVSKGRFKRIVSGGKYHNSNYLYAL